MRWLSGDRRGSRHFVSRSIAEKRVVAVGFFQPNMAFVASPTLSDPHVSS
jgi:hypothetical protein